MAAFDRGLPLSCDQLHYLRQHRAQIKHPLADTLYRYYRVDGPMNNVNKGKTKKQMTIEKIKARIAKGLEKRSSFTLSLNPKEYLKFRALLMNDLIFLHGNHMLTGAPFFAGGVPYTQLFQWGNLFGIVKYEEILGETATDANILIYFEEQNDRTIAEVLHDWHLKHELDIDNPAKSLKYRRS